MSLPKCLTDNNKVHKYDAAFPLNSKLTISPRLKFIGVGIIVEVDGKRYFGKDRLKFYRVKKVDIVPNVVIH